jgi:hypothetical protein
MEINGFLFAWPSYRDNIFKCFAMCHSHAAGLPDGMRLLHILIFRLTMSIQILLGNINKLNMVENVDTSLELKVEIEWKKKECYIFRLELKMLMYN